MENPGVISLSLDIYSIREDAETLVIPIMREEGSDGTVSVDYSINNSSAIAEEDFVADSGTLVFKPGETSKEVAISLIDDNIPEANETYSFAIGNSLGTVLGDTRTANITIIDNDTPETSNVAFTAAKYQVKESEGKVSLIVTRTGNINKQITVDYYTRDNYAHQGKDYLSNSGTLSFDSGEISKKIDITILDDDFIENKESFFVKLVNPERVELGAQHTARVVLEEDKDEVPDHFEEEVVISGLAEGETGDINVSAGPTAFDWTPDGETMFIAKLNGTVKVHQNNELLATPFIDLSSQVNSAGHRGMLGLAVHPEFPEQPYVYMAFSYDPPDVKPNQADDAPRVTRLIRVTADPKSNYTTALPDSEVVLLETPAVNNFHAAGEIEFAPDGSLFFSHGDGAPVDGPATLESAELLQSLDNPLGKLLRIDPITGKGYTDNPFYDGDVNSIQSKIYNYGLRNPWRYTFHPETGEPVIGDVGWTEWEEINTGRGKNFGWPLYEGGNGINSKTKAIAEDPKFVSLYENFSDVTAPIYGFHHNYGGGSINLGDFYTGEIYPDLYQGAAFLTKDFIMDQDYPIYALLFDEEGNPDSLTPIAEGTAITQIAVGPDSHVYFSSLSTGEISRVIVPEDEESKSNSSKELLSEENVVYSLFNPSVGVYFYTDEEQERDFVLEKLDNYELEQPYYKAVDSSNDHAREVYRFFNSTTGAHLYTTSDVEKDNIIDNLDDFNFEGKAFYAYENYVDNSIPIHRFYESTTGIHIYTASKNEIDNYDYEGIAYYALSIDAEF